MSPDDRPTALLVENDYPLNLRLQKELEDVGFFVFLAESNSAAKQYIQRQKDFDLVVLDLFLNIGADGWEILNIFLSNPEIFSSGRGIIFSAQGREAERAISSGWDFIEKGAGSIRRLRTISNEAYSVARLLPTPNPQKLRQTIACMQPKGWQNLYVLGCFDKAMTLYSQQARALTLTRSLYETGQLRKNVSVGIVGAGVAGVTAAIGAALLGCKVTLIEKASAPFHLQAPAAHRFLHPHIYYWPQKGSTDTDAGFPFLNWSADQADKVVEHLREDFSKYKEHFGRKFIWKSQTLVTTVERFDDKVRLKAEGFQKTFDVVILAIGYGKELGPSYWSNDLINGPYDPSSTLKILISGAGDGALIDLARATIRTAEDQSFFHHDQAIERLSKIAGFNELASAMSKIDKEVELSRTPTNLTKRYEKLRIPKTLRSKIKSLKRPETEVVWHYRNDEPFKLGSSLINRLIGLLLKQTGVVSYRSGALPESTEREFDIVVKRYGLHDGYFKESFPELFNACRELITHAKLELTGGRIDRETLRFWKAVKWNSGIT